MPRLKLGLQTATVSGLNGPCCGSHPRTDIRVSAIDCSIESGLGGIEAVIPPNLRFASWHPTSRLLLGHLVHAGRGVMGRARGRTEGLTSTTTSTPRNSATHSRVAARRPSDAEVAQKLKEYLKWRQDHGIMADALFVTTWGLPWSESSWGFNKTIRTFSLPGYNRWASDKGRPGLQFGAEEILKMTTHRMRRHVFGTVYATQLPAKTLMDYMGITEFSVVQR